MHIIELYLKNIFDMLLFLIAGIEQHLRIRNQTHGLCFYINYKLWYCSVASIQIINNLLILIRLNLTVFINIPENLLYNFDEYHATCIFCDSAAIKHHHCLRTCLTISSRLSISNSFYLSEKRSEIMKQAKSEIKLTFLFK